MRGYYAAMTKITLPVRSPNQPNFEAPEDAGEGVAPDVQALIDAAVAKALQSQADMHQSSARELPRPSEVDASKISRMTLTTDGWIVPANLGVPAAAIKA